MTGAIHRGVPIFWFFLAFLIPVLGICQETDQTGRPDTPQAGIVINFDDADLYEVIRTFAEILDITYIVDPEVRGKVTIHTAGHLERGDLFPVFFNILEINGLTAVKEGSLYKIISLKDAPRMPLSGKFGEKQDHLSPQDRVIIQILPLRFLSVEEATKLLTPFISADGTIVSHKDTNTLVIVDKRFNIQKAVRLIQAFDVDIFKSHQYRFYSLDHAEAEALSKALGDIFSPYNTSEKKSIRFIPFERLNLLLAIGFDERIFPQIDALVKQLDVPGQGTEPEIYIYAVKNGEAAELAELLREVFSDVGSSAERRVRSEKGGAPANLEQENRTSPFPNSGKKTEEKVSNAKRSESVSNVDSGPLKTEVKITADEIRNVLIIEATPKDYEIVKRILNRLDILPRQVLIEVTIAEITLDAKTELGVEWTYVKGSGGEPSTSLLSATMGSTGLQYVIGQVDRWKATLSALATQNKVNILNTPSILASDNKEAKIDVSTEIPVASAQYQYDSGNEPLLQTNIQYRNTGVILSVVPHINEFGLVSMEISQEVSEQSESVQVGQESMPSFFKRSVNTSLTVKNGQTIVIGGLIRENENAGSAGVPCLGDIPVLGFLFGRQSKAKDKTELVILITPRVIASLEDVDTLTEEFKSKVGNALRHLNQ